jgi:lipopolysaccharide assembly protein A
MRWVYLILLLVIVAIIIAFLVENNDHATIKLFSKSLNAPLSWFFIAVYFLGMWSGGTVVAFIRRAYHRATEHVEQKRG